MTNGESLRILGIELVGATPENGRKVLLSLILLLGTLAFAWLGRRLTAGRRGGGYGAASASGQGRRSA